jgi:hypothetical protein
MTSTNSTLRAWLSGKSDRKSAQPQLPRATLNGLEVAESTFGDWLAAGGERRTKPRAAAAKPSAPKRG